VSNLSKSSETISVGDWIVTFIVLAIPLVNIGAILYWAFSGSANPSKRTYAQASLIMFAVAVVFYLLVVVIFGINLGASGPLTTPE